MNDFTKKELDTIRVGVGCVHVFVAVKEEVELCKELSEKIQSMIENYCEHGDYRKEDRMVSVCNKCHKVFDDE